MKRYKAVCAYDGTDFEGWQRQTTKTGIQDCIEGVLSDIAKDEIQIHGSGRTDAGVHAKGQVFHWDMHWPYETNRLKKALNSKLPETVQVLSVVSANEDFHARYSAKKKRYVYHIHETQALPHERRYIHSLGMNTNLEIDLMNQAASYMIGEHDFTAFSGVSRHSKKQNPIKTLYEINILKKGPRIKIEILGSGFLYKMARSIAGSLIHVGQGRVTPKELQQFLKKPIRTKAILTAPAKALFLDKVYYR